jgi:hypothetical protein
VLGVVAGVVLGIGPAIRDGPPPADATLATRIRRCSASRRGSVAVAAPRGSRRAGGAPGRRRCSSPTAAARRGAASKEQWAE